MRDPEQERAFRATSYWVDDPGGGRFAVRCDEPSARLDHLLAAAGVSCWAFVTACNPRAERLPPDENRLRMGLLAAAVRRRGWAWLPGAGVADRGDWPAEPSLLLLGATAADAAALARAFGQLAILVGEAGGPARLAWVEDA